MDRSVALRAGIGLAVSVALVSVALAIALPKSFFEDWGWLAGPAAWLTCGALVGRLLRLPLAQTLTGAVLAGLPGIPAVLAGVHWVGPALGVVLFGLWCGRLAVDPDLPAEVV
jgi:hypothetical protein